MANQFLTLSLFIMLLSFFIILNTMASYSESKSSPIIRSLAIALSLDSEDNMLSQSTEANADLGSGEGSSIDRLRGLFENHIAGFESSENRFGTELYASVPLDEFEKALVVIDKQGFQSDNKTAGFEKDFLPTLVSILLSEDNGIAYSMKILLNTEENPALLLSDDPQAVQPIMSKVATFANILEKVGLPSNQMDAGVERGDPELVTLLFQPYQPYIPVEEEGINP